jgi:hypothetical protein
MMMLLIDGPMKGQFWDIEHPVAYETFGPVVAGDPGASVEPLSRGYYYPVSYVLMGKRVTFGVADRNADDLMDVIQQAFWDHLASDQMKMITDA